MMTNDTTNAKQLNPDEPVFPLSYRADGHRYLAPVQILNSEDLETVGDLKNVTLETAMVARNKTDPPRECVILVAHYGPQEEDYITASEAAKL